MISSLVSVLLTACGRKTSFDAEMIKPFESEFKFPVVQVKGNYVLEAWEYLSKDTSVSPVVIGDPENLLYISEGLEFSESETIEEILLKAKTLDFPRGLKEMRRAEMEVIIDSSQDNPAFKALLDRLGASQGAGSTVDDILSNWPRGRTHRREKIIPSVAIDWSTELPFETIIIALIPTSDWTEVPAYMRFGGYNDCPGPEWHIAALRYYREINDVRLIGVSHETLDLISKKPPETREDAAQLAVDLYDYCSDIVDQGSGSISEFARDLMIAPLWSLWWD